MILRVDIRANGGQLADYISAHGENDHVEILEVDGRIDANKDYLRQTIVSMELNAQLTKCKNAYLHTQINPAYGEDQKMTPDDWSRAADILAEELGYQDQRRVIVLHTKKGRTHAHVVWERYHHDTCKVIPTKNSRLNAKFARVRMEKEFAHKRTAWRNDKTHIKETLTDLWSKTKDGADFIKQARKAGYIVSAGTGNRPFMVVNQDGVSCDLVRQLNGIRTKEVRARLRHEELMTDKQAIELVRAEQTASSGKRGREQPVAKPTVSDKTQDFAANASETFQSEQQIHKERINRFNEFAQQGANFVDDKREPEQKPPTPAEKIASEFADNKTEAINPDAVEQERLRENIRQAQQKIHERKKRRGPRR